MAYLQAEADPGFGDHRDTMTFNINISVLIKIDTGPMLISVYFLNTFVSIYIEFL